VAAILDWRSGSSGPTLFDQYYSTIAPTFRARHASFEEIEELLLVRGMTPELFYGNYIPDAEGRLYASGGLRDCLSVWGGAGPFDVNSASPALMEAVGVPPQGVAAIVEYRRLQPFHNMGEVSRLGFATPRLGTGGNYIWTLRATARLRRPDGTPSETVRSAAAVVKVYADRRRHYLMPVEVMRWYDDAWSQSAVAPPPGAFRL
jgi:general secretion pathway protein K